LAFCDWMVAGRSEKYDGSECVLAEAQTNVCGEHRGYHRSEMAGWIWEDIQFVLVDVIFLSCLLCSSVNWTDFRSCALSIDTPRNTRVSFLFICCAVSRVSWFVGKSPVLCMTLPRRKCAIAPSLDTADDCDIFLHFYSTKPSLYYHATLEKPRSVKARDASVQKTSIKVICLNLSTLPLQSTLSRSIVYQRSARHYVLRVQLQRYVMSCVLVDSRGRDEDEVDRVDVEEGLRTSLA
jgi:hypothetical protein